MRGVVAADDGGRGAERVRPIEHRVSDCDRELGDRIAVDHVAEVDQTTHSRRTIGRLDNQDVEVIRVAVDCRPPQRCEPPAVASLDVSARPPHESA